MSKQDRDAFRKGKRSELAVLQALQQLRREGVIRGFSFVDKPGIDFRLTLPTGRVLPLQVKSSYIGRRVHASRYPGVPCVAVRYNDQKGSTPKEDVLVENVCESIRNCVNDFQGS